MTRQIITLEEASKIPALTTTENAGYLSKGYVQLNTFQIMEKLAENGWKPVHIKGTNTLDKNPFAFHTVRFTHDSLPELKSKEGHIELILNNSHNGKVKFKFGLGVYRLVCSNGLISGTEFDSFQTRHIGINPDEVMEAVYRIVDESNHLVSKVEEMKNTSLKQTQIIQLAKDGIQLKFNNPDHIDPALVIQPRRPYDKGTDLWTTFNVIQENLVKGGLQYQTPSGRSQTTKPIIGAHMDYLFNTNLWKKAASLIN